jgi:hypothetical protein
MAAALLTFLTKTLCVFLQVVGGKLLMVLELAEKPFTQMLEEHIADCAQRGIHVSQDPDWLSLMIQHMVQVG